jgi:hypothetical protein
VAALGEETGTVHRYRSFSDFSPQHLREHSRAATRGLRYAGTSLILLVADLRMFALSLTGRLESGLEAAGIASPHRTIHD